MCTRGGPLDGVGSAQVGNVEPRGASGKCKSAERCGELSVPVSHKLGGCEGLDGVGRTMKPWTDEGFKGSGASEKLGGRR